MASDEAYILVSRWYKSARAQSYREPPDSGPLEPCLYRGNLQCIDCFQMWTDP